MTNNKQSEKEQQPEAAEESEKESDWLDSSPEERLKLEELKNFNEPWG